jgi:3-oxoadipate enol-lactonase
VAINRRIPTRVGALAVADCGAGTPVVLWPSLFSDHHLYHHVVGQLSENWRTISIDGPGFGRSDPPVGDVQPERYADAVADVLDELAIGETYFAGCSWGGQVGAHFAVRHARRARGVLLMNTPLEPNRNDWSPLVPATRWFGSTTLFGTGVARSMTSKETRHEYPDRIREFVSAMTSFDPASAATTVRTVMTRSAGVVDLLTGIDVPLAFLMGADDQLCPVDRLLPVARTAVGAAVVVVPRCGHLAPLEAPQFVAQMLTELHNRTGGWRP